MKGEEREDEGRGRRGCESDFGIDVRKRDANGREELGRGVRRG